MKIFQKKILMNQNMKELLKIKIVNKNNKIMKKTTNNNS